MDIKDLYETYKRNPIICTDTRQLAEGCIFFALSGSNFDGNKFAKDALQSGAAFAVVTDKSLEGQNLIYVPDTLQALQSLAVYHRRHFNIPFIGITGSNGKTTTKELITKVLATQYKVHATKGNYNNHIGVPLTILGMKEDTEIAVIEMGANHAGEIKLLCEIAMPTHGIITNIGKAHLEGFGSIEGVQKAKGELFDYLKDHNGWAFVNTDDPYIDELTKNMTNKTTYGFNGTPSIHFHYSVEGAGNGFTIARENQNVIIHSSMFGQYNATNMVAAYSVGQHFNVDPGSITKVLTTFIPGQNRSEIISHESCTIIKDAYNANPTSMEFALSSFAERYPEGLPILGDMKELGAESLNAHQQIIELLQKLNFKQVVLIGTEFGKALSQKSNAHSQEFTTMDSIEELKENWQWENYRGRAILLKGSRSMHLEKLLDP